jgi:peptidoglycan hydrolase CwlO-like protein
VGDKTERVETAFADNNKKYAGLMEKERLHANTVQIKRSQAQQNFKEMNASSQSSQRKVEHLQSELSYLRMQRDDLHGDMDKVKTALRELHTQMQMDLQRQKKMRSPRRSNTKYSRRLLNRERPYGN